jgi:hypothetical protein
MIRRFFRGAWPRRAGLALTLFLLVFGTQAARPSAHEVPTEATVYTFLKPEGNQLYLLVRAPMKSLRDVDIPTKENGFLDLARADQSIEDAAWLWIGDFVKVYENDAELPKPQVAGARVSLPGDKSFASFDEALANIRGPKLPETTDIYWEQGLLDVAFVYPIGSDTSKFGISPGLTRLGLRVNVVMRFLPPGSPERAFDVHGDPGIVRLDPSWVQAAWLFVQDGFRHILDGIDHLLFLACLVIPFRRLRPLAVVVTSFTIAHSVTLIASAFDLAPTSLWFPPLVETLIAVSIVYMAFENIAIAASGHEESRRSLDRRWLITFAFGLIHGFGFSFALRETLQFAGQHLISSLLAFNVGVELGQLAVLLVLVPVLNVVFRRVVPEKVGTILLSALVAHTGWHWASERGSQLAQFPFPTLDLVAVAAGMRLAMVIVAAAGVTWLFSLLMRPGTAPSREAEAGAGGKD